MDDRAVVETLEAMQATVAVLSDYANVSGTAGTAGGGAGADPLREQADACLDGLAEVARLEARLAALKVHFADGYVAAAGAVAARASSPQERTA